MITKPKPDRSKHLKIRADQLAIHPFAQRDIVPPQLKRLVDNLDLDAIGTVHAVEYEITGRGHKVWVVDGQHRIRALLEHGFGEWMVNVQIHTDVNDDARASELFLALNATRQPSPFDRFKNQVRANNDDAVAIQDIVRSKGFKVTRTTGDGNIVGISALHRSYKFDDGKALAKALGVMADAWGRRQFDAKIIEGIASVFAKYNGSIDEPVMTKKLAKYPGGAAGLIGDARGLMTFRKIGFARCVAERIIETYNSGKRGGKLETSSASNT